MSTYNITIPDIHQGTAYLWYNVQLPATGQLLLIDQYGAPTQGSPQPLGASSGPVKISAKDKIERVMIDQSTGPVDAILTEQEAMFECTLSQSSLLLISTYLASSLYSSGTNSGLPSGAQNYEELTSGGLATIPQAPVAVISPRRGFNNPQKFYVFVLYNAYGMAEYDTSFTRTKESTWKITFTGLNVLTRPLQDQMFQYYRQT